MKSGEKYYSSALQKFKRPGLTESKNHETGTDTGEASPDCYLPNYWPGSVNTRKHCETQVPNDNTVNSEPGHPHAWKLEVPAYTFKYYHDKFHWSFNLQAVTLQSPNNEVSYLKTNLLHMNGKLRCEHRSYESLSTTICLRSVQKVSKLKSSKYIDMCLWKVKRTGHWF